MKSEVKKFIFTGSSNDLGFFEQNLEKSGFEIFGMPLIETSPIWFKPIATGKHLKVEEGFFDWIVLTSAAAVNYLKTFSPTDNTKFAAVGPKTKHALEGIGIEVEFIPIEFTAKTLAEQVPVISGQNILLLQGNLTRGVLSEGLKNRGCLIDELVVYQVEPVQYCDDEKVLLIEQLSSGDGIVFFSPSAVKNFVSVFGVELAPKFVISIGPTTTHCLKESGFEVSIEANPHSGEGIVESIKYLVS